MQMNTSALKTYIESGKADAKLRRLYGASKVSSQKERYINAIDKFTELFGDSEDVRIFSVPGRTEVSGNHTDHNRGRVLAASIDLDIIAVAAADETGTIRIKSEGFDMDEVCIETLEPDPDLYFKSAALIKGMCRGFADKGYKYTGFHAYTTSNVYKGSGLSSSAAFEVMVGNILRTLCNEEVSDVEIAAISQFAENVFFGKPCGLMDQLACAVGGFIAIDFEDPKDPKVESIKFDLSKAGYSLCIVDTGGNHADLNEDYASVPAEMKQVAKFFGKSVLREVSKNDLIASMPALREKCGDRAILRALHFINENKRVLTQIEALKKHDLETFFRLVKESGDSSFKFLQNVYTTKNVNEQGLSLALELAEEFLSRMSVPCACRVHGGGFAGTIQAFVPSNYAQGFAALMELLFGEGRCHILHVRSEGAICII